MGKRGPKSFAELATIRPGRPLPAPDRLKLAPDPPPPPAHLQPSTKSWWACIVAEYEFAPHDLRALQSACEAWDRGQQAREALAVSGLTYVDGKGMIRARPEVAIERDSRTGFLRALRELRLEPPAPPQGPHPWELAGRKD